MKTLIAAIALSLTVLSQTVLAAPKAAAAAPGSAIVVEGRVGRFLEPGMFWLDGYNGTRTLVYSNGETTKALRSGQTIRVTGSVPLDWAKLAESEVSASRIERVGI